MRTLSAYFHWNIFMILKFDRLFVSWAKFCLEGLELDFWHLFDFYLERIRQLSNFLIDKRQESAHLLRFCGIVLEIKLAVVFIIWNEVFIKSQRWVSAANFISTLRNMLNLSLVYFSFDCLNKDFLFDQVASIYNDFVCIDFSIIFNNEFSFMSTWNFGSEFEFEKAVVCIVYDESFFIYGVL